MLQDEYKKDFHSQKFCWVLDGRTLFQPQNAKEYLIKQKRSEQFAVGYLVLLKDEYYRLREQKKEKDSWDCFSQIVD